MILALAAPAASQSVLRLDRGQAETAGRLIGDGDEVRLYCKPCADVAYSTVTVSSTELRPAGESFTLHLNGEPVDAAQIYVDAGYGDGWENLAVLVGAAVEIPAAKLSRALDDVADLAPHAGSYTGRIGEAAVRLELVLAGRKLDGSYLRVEGGHEFKLLATAYNRTSRGESLTLIERGADDRVTATLQGQLEGASGRFKGVRTPLGGAAAEPFELSRAPRSGE